MSQNDNLPTASPGTDPSVTGRTNWVVGIGIAIIVVTVAGLGLTSLLADARMLPIVLITIAVIGGAAIAVWIIEWPRA